MEEKGYQFLLMAQIDLANFVRPQSVKVVLAGHLTILYYYIGDNFKTRWAPTSCK